MSPPLTLPESDEQDKPTPTENPFSDIAKSLRVQQGDANPFRDIAETMRSVPPGLAGLSAAEQQRHRDILARNEAGQQRAAAETAPLGDQIIAGLKSAYQGVRHPIDTGKQLVSHALEDLGTVGSAMDAGIGQPSDLTPERAKDVPRAMVNTAATIALPLAPATGVLTRGAINAALGAINDPEQPARGATAAVVLGEGLHQAPGFIPQRIKPPAIRLNETSEPLRNAAFAQTLEQGAPAATARGVESVSGYEPTAVVSRASGAKPRPEGFEPGANPFGDIADALKRQKPIDAEPSSAGPEGQAAEGQSAINDRYAAEDARMEELNRQAALRWLTGVRRRPGGVKENVGPRDAEGLSPEKLLDAVSPPGPPDQADVPSRLALATRAAAQNPFDDVAATLRPSPSGPLPSYPDGLAMGGLEGRIPALPKHVLPRSEPLPAPEGATAETVKAAMDLKPNPYRGHTTDQLVQAAMDEQAAIEAAQRNLQMDGEASMRHNDSTGESISDQAPRYDNKGQTLQRSLNRMAKIEREFALRGIQGNDLSDLMAAARERRLEQQGQDADLRMGIAPGASDFSFGAAARPETTSRPSQALGTVPEQGVPRPLRPGESLVNRGAFSSDPDIQAQLAESERNLLAGRAGKRIVPIAEGQQRARTFAEAVGVDPKSIDLAKAAQFSGEQIVGLQQAAQTRMAQIAELSKRLADPTLSTAQREEIGHLIDTARDARESLIDAISKGRSQKGRDLNFLKQMTEHSLDPDVWEMQARKFAGDRVLSDETIADVRRLAREAQIACGGA